ncbi:uncharacterized protein L201_005055 [Kwoniella dendrophila CBS 6074]|uniref:TRIP4/RQT4 C2HC5-type zinc finger domain-containing protein n=1 Tax=Kwoniella dendrophila CBS 6074 TaxID=1295534 RepID=A0AAX4JXS3_9TREE
MAFGTPAWVVKDLSAILGLDDETIKQMIIPDLESYNHEARLRVHLQDFLGSTPQAKSFTTRYLSLKFPSLTSTSTPSSIPSQTLTPNPDLLKPKTNTFKNQKSKSPNNGLSRPSSNAGSSSAGIVTNKDIPEALEAAFGPGGKVYKKKEFDDLGWGGISSSKPSSFGNTPRSGYNSGSQTPSNYINNTNNVPVQRLRQAGAINIQIQQPQPQSQSQSQRLDPPVIGNGSGIGSRTNSSKGKQREDNSSKGKEKIWDVPKSKQVKKLEKIKENLRIVKEGDGKLKEQGLNCFCQARVHPLSTYTPICQSCGLTICSIQLPYLPCPSCFNPLSTPAQLSRLILRIEGEIEIQLNKEERERQLIEKERLERLAIEAGGGSFPTLSSNSSIQQGNVTMNAPGGRKVISIGNKIKGKTKITTTTYTNLPSTSSNTGSGIGSRAITPEPENIIPRLREKPIDSNKLEKELNKLINYRFEQNRLFADLKLDKKGENIKYKELYIPTIQLESQPGRRRKGKAKRLGENGREVPGA